VTALDNKKKVRNLLLYLGIPILIIIITAAVLSTNKSTSPKTSELEQYFVQDMVDSFNIDYGSGQIEITLKEGMSPIKSTDSDSQSATTATQPATEQQKTQSNSKKSKIVVKGQLADIQRFLDDIKPYYNPASTDEIPHNLTRATDNSILMEMIPTLIIMIILIVAWVLIMKKMGGGNSMMFNMGKSLAKPRLRIQTMKSARQHLMMLQVPMKKRKSLQRLLSSSRLLKSITNSAQEYQRAFSL
jgi:cell division protease FtsH